ncbi:hypothetical protein [Aquabacterium sp.]|uniref:hypothetical protein n=1 Tax=Aquabacterium sp. TaxID=1872578 RepID=UPI0025C2FDC9|nr:hypothetical protein [Aquabacterium sp.]
MSLKPTRSHLSRLMKIWRSAGWPSRDPIDIDLLAAGWVSLVGDHPAQECLRLTDAGIAVLAQSRQAQRRAESDHDKLALRMSDLLTASGRLVWRELSLRAQVEADAPPQQGNLVAVPGEPSTLWGDDALDTDSEDIEVSLDGAQPSAAKAYRWRMTRPDLFSVRRTSNPAYLQPMVHEVKVSRADLLSDLRHTAKRTSYQWLCSECHYVFPHGMAEPQELPEELGVWVIHGDIDIGQLELLRPARHAPCTIPFDVWMAMAKASPVRRPLERSQGELANADEPDDTESHAEPD